MKKLFITLAAAGLATTAFAQAPDFAATDSDKSGEVSYAEALVVWADLTAAAFATADADQSGGLNATEFATLASAN